MANRTQLVLALFAGVLLLLALGTSFGPGPSSTTSLSYSDFMDRVEAGDVSEVVLRGQEISARNESGERFSSFAPAGAELFTSLRENGVRVEVEAPPGPSILGSVLSALLPLALLIGVWWYIMRRAQGGLGGGGALGLGKSKARLLTQEAGRVTFEDVAGVDEAKQELEEVVQFLRAPDKFSRLGGKIPRGALLVGPPGTGKTLLARAVAGEANVPFFTVSGSEFVEMVVGVGASRVRDMFDQAKKNAPCIIFIDEIDAVGRQRGAGLGGGHDEREQTLNQLLVEMDGFEGNDGVIVMAATNRPDVLDPALLRPGRFDRQVVVPNPDVTGREQILNVHVRKVPLAPNVDVRTVARGTPGFSGAQLANLVNEAALLAARAGRRLVSMQEFEDARDKVIMGPERRSMAMTQEEKELTAYHEAGHTLVGLYVPGNDPLHKVTIIPRGRALGVTMSLPERDRLSFRKAEAEARLAMMFGGRVAEEIVYGAEHVTTGAANDIQQATDLARRMVTEWGMSDRLGPVRYSQTQDEVFLGRSVTQAQGLSEHTAEAVDEEVRAIVMAAEDKARQVLTEHRAELDRLTAALIEYETLSADQVSRVLQGDLPESRAEDTRQQGSVIPLAGRRKKPDTSGGPNQKSAA